MNAPTSESIGQLSVAERIQLVEDIWDSIAAAPDSLDITQSQRDELDNRLASHAKAPVGSSWDDVKSRPQS